MLFSVSEPSRSWAAVAAVAGIGSYVFPLLAPWHLLFPILAALAVLGSVGSRSYGVLICLFMIAAVLAGVLPSQLAASILAAIVLASSAIPVVGAIILLLNASIFATLQQLIAQGLHPFELEIAAPSLLAIAAIASIKLRNLPLAGVAAGFTLLIALIAARLSVIPQVQMAFVTLPVCLFAVLTALGKPDAPCAAIPVAVTLAFLALSWLSTPPRSWSDTFLLLPSADDAPEAKFFKNYDKALAFAGISAKRAIAPEEIPARSLVLLPWLTAALDVSADAQFAERVGDLARKRKWTVLIAGEHTDLGGSAKRIERMAGRPILRSDLTVPPNNTDDSGPLHVLDFRDWPHESILNRGASVRVNSLWDKVLLAGDGWWAERDIGEWLWVGDYVWQRGDRTGRLALALASDDGGARWVALGDNSFLINSQIYADPRSLLRILELANLWPVFIRDILLSVFAAFMCIPIASIQANRRSLIISLASLSLPGVAMISIVNPGPGDWLDTYLRQSGFDQRNFNTVFAEYPALFERRRILRIRAPISGRLELPPDDVLIFATVDGKAAVGDVILNNCRRLGALPTAEGPHLMDGQSCRVEGTGRILIGSSEGAAAIATMQGERRVMVVLDTAFLAQNAPNSNVDWLLGELKNWETQTRRE